MYFAALGHPVHRRGRMEKVRPVTGREAGLGHARERPFQEGLLLV